MSILPRTHQPSTQIHETSVWNKNNNVAFRLHFVNLLNAWIRKTHFTEGLLDENKKKRAKILSVAFYQIDSI